MGLHGDSLAVLAGGSSYNDTYMQIIQTECKHGGSGKVLTWRENKSATAAAGWGVFDEK
jgi:hypothetical protein